MRTGSLTDVTCYAESPDGIHWVKPNLGLYEVMGSRENNVVLAGDPPLLQQLFPFSWTPTPRSAPGSASRRWPGWATT